MADVVKAPVPFEIGAAWVQIPVVPAIKMPLPPTEGGPIVLTGRKWKTS